MKVLSESFCFTRADDEKDSDPAQGKSRLPGLPGGTSGSALGEQVGPGVGVRPSPGLLGVSTLQRPRTLSRPAHTPSTGLCGWMPLPRLARGVR